MRDFMWTGLWRGVVFVATIVTVLFAVSHAECKTFCVDTVVEFQDALDEAETNAQDDTILLVRGNYSSPLSADGRFFYGSSEPFGLTIEGDWVIFMDDCTRFLPPNPANTIIDGGGSVTGLHLQVLTDESVSVFVKYIRFENGFYSGTAHRAGGLDLDTGNEVSVTVEGNIFYNNQTGGYGGGLNVGTGGRLRVVNNLFASNGAGTAFGAAYLIGNGSAMLGAGVEIYNNTVVYNFHTESDTGEGGFSLGGTASACYVDNNIFWGNEGADFNLVNPNCTMLGNDIQDFSGTPTWNEGALSVYPGFKSLLPSDYRLRTTSPLINQGYVRITNLSMPSVDLDGLPRFSADSPVDIGAYEVELLFYGGFDDGTTDAWSEVSP